MDDQWPHLHYDMGFAYDDLLQYDRAIPEYEKALEIFEKTNSKPWWPSNYTNLGKAYHETGQYKKEKKLYRKAELDFPDNPAILRRQAILSLAEKDFTSANKYIEKYKSISSDISLSEGDIMTGLAEIYSEAGLYEKAEEYYRKALSLEPDKPARLNSLAWLLIDKNRNIDEGLELSDKAIQLSPDNYVFLDCKGWGLFKKKRIEEALKLLEKSDSLKPIYNHILYLHLEEVKKTIAK
jgi:tetratricopeptide (TPR) repeat protein